ncbi:hypothetical protein WJT86_10090 [Microvirga sp. W0021]|uniref:Uncharacterized protein n=1 Tax=Hohaiivirga grylli TaxID=3133970 RepID=A0ABV0BL27_9HYPH
MRCSRPPDNGLYELRILVHIRTRCRGPGITQDREKVNMTENMTAADMGSDSYNQFEENTSHNPEGMEEFEAEDTLSEAVADDENTEGVKTVPLATFLEMRNEVKASRAEAEELRRILVSVQQEGVKPPDPVTDPVAYQQHMEMQRIQQQQQQEALEAQQHLGFIESSLESAKEHLGQDFEAAYEMARANPQVAKYILCHPNPGGALVEFHKQLQRNGVLERYPTGVLADDWLLEQSDRPNKRSNGPISYQKSHLAAPPPSLAGARGGNASVMAPVLSDDPIDDILK